MKPTGTGTGGTPQGAPTGTIQEAASAFMSALEPAEDADNSGGDGAQDEQEGGSPEGEALEGSESEGEVETTDDSEESGESGESEGEDEEGSADDDQAEGANLFTVRVDGKEEQVPLAELIAGYSRTSDYTRKTQQVAEQRKALTAEMDAVRAERAEYSQHLPKLRKALEGSLGDEPDWEALRAQDPQKAAIEWQRREDIRRRLSAVSREEARVAEAEARDRAAEAEQIAIEQYNLLIKALPSWRDPKVATAEANMVRDALVAAGYDEKELKMYDHRAILVALKAARYDKLMAEKKTVKGKVLRAPIAQPGAAKKPQSRQNARVEEAAVRFRKSGRVSDAAGLFESLL